MLLTIITLSNNLSRPCAASRTIREEIEINCRLTGDAIPEGAQILAFTSLITIVLSVHLSSSGGPCRNLPVNSGAALPACSTNVFVAQYKYTNFYNNVFKISTACSASPLFWSISITFVIFPFASRFDDPSPFIR